MSLNTNTRNSSKSSYINSKSNNIDLKCNYYLCKGHVEATCYKKCPYLRKDQDNNKSVKSIVLLLQLLILPVEVAST